MPTKKVSSVTKETATQPANYNNNPFTIAVEGSKLLFQKAPTLALILAILSALGASNYDFSQPTATDTTGAPMTDMAMEPAVIAIIVVIGVVLLFGILVFGSILAGIYAYTAAEIAKGREVSFKVAAKATFDRLWSFVWLQVLIIGKVFLWLLLFIVPGIIMAFRYSLANLSFFDSDKKLTGNAAIKDSLALTKGAWVTTFASQMLLDIITLGAITPIIDTGSRAMLYRQFTAMEGVDKPKPHVLSWVTLGLVILIVVLIISLLGYALVNYGLTLIGA
jgi:hypothetical protein